MRSDLHSKKRMAADFREDKHVLRAEKKQNSEVSLSDPIGVDGDGNEISLADILGSDPDQVQRDVESRIASEQVRCAVDAALSGRERTVIKLR